MALSTPVAFLIFNRPLLTRVVFAAIAQAKPKRLLVVADGPRFPEEAEKCEKARAIIQRVNWDCEILTNFSETNLGCKRRVSSGLDWVFDTVEEAVILEDDCLPHPTFFRFCEELLDRYRDDQRIMMVSGDNYQLGEQQNEYSYYYSRYTHIWGWGTWRRAWHFFDANMTLWPEVKDSGWIDEIYETAAEADYRRNCFERTYSGAIDTWDYAWSFACLIQNGLVIRPSTNLVCNIGFGPDATHTKGKSAIANFQRSRMAFPLRHPPYILRDSRSDRYEVERLLGISPAADSRIKRLRKEVPGLLKDIRGLLRPSTD
jgi:hypothetical protein